MGNGRPSGAELQEGCKAGYDLQCSRCWATNSSPVPNTTTCACDIGYTDSNTGTGNLDQSCIGEGSSRPQWRV